MSELDDRLADSQRVTDYLRKLQGGSPVEPPVDPPVNPPTEPPQTGGQFLGDLTFNGARFETSGVVGGVFCYARFIIPEGFDGKSTQISYSEYIGPQIYRTVTLRQTPGDFSTDFPGIALGASGGIGVSFGRYTGAMVTVYPGEVWYFNCRCTYEDGRPTAQPGQSVDFQITPASPS